MTAPTTVFLVRHGATATTGRVLPGRAPGLHLSGRGRAQADAVASRLGALDPAPAALYTSPLERARETAAPIARALGLRARAMSGLTECDFGEWTGRRLSALRRRSEWRHVQHSPSTFAFPGGESFAAMQRRVWGALEALAERHPGQRVVAVSHADPIKAAVTFAMGVPLDLFQRATASTCSVSALVLTGGAPHVLCLNSTGSLAELAPS